MIYEYINGKAVGHDILKEISESRKPKAEAKAEEPTKPEAEAKVEEKPKAEAKK